MKLIGVSRAVRTQIEDASYSSKNIQYICCKNCTLCLGHWSLHLLYIKFWGVIFHSFNDFSEIAPPPPVVIIFYIHLYKQTYWTKTAPWMRPKSWDEIQTPCVYFLKSLKMSLRGKNTLAGLISFPLSLSLALSLSHNNTHSDTHHHWDKMTENS